MNISRIRELSPSQSRTEQQGAQASPELTRLTLPISTILLPLMVYANLWIIDKIPGLDWFDRTFPRVLETILLIVYFVFLWLTGPAPSRLRLARVRIWRTIIALGLITISVLQPTVLFIHDRLERGPFPNNVIDWPLQIEQGSALVLQGRSPYGYDYSRTE